MPANGIETITLDELHKRMELQGVATNHIAFKCPICATVQSMASLVKAGCEPERVDNVIGFSCEGRFSGAGEWPASTDTSAKAAMRRKVRGCNWTLGGLLQIHRLAVIMPDDGRIVKSFELATPEEAQALAKLMAERVPA